MPHGVLWDFSIHHLDALRVRFPAPPEGVSARLGSRRVAVHMVWEQAQVSYEHADRRGGYAYRERIDGSRGALVVDDQVVRLVHSGARRGTTVTPPPARAPEDIVLDEFVAAVESGRPSALDAADNIQTVALVERIVASAS
jgi:predicted dehydrogenase